MKKLLLIAKKSNVLHLYLSSLEKIFNGYLEVIGHVTEDEDHLLAHNKLVQADIVVTTNPYSFPYARKYMKEHAKIINLNFTFEKQAVERLKKFPVGTETLVCFNFYSSSHHAANTLYELGLENLNLYIHYPGNKNLINKKIDLALISSYAEDIPYGIPVVFDLGPRRISFSTILEIAIYADALDGKLEKKIYDYCEQSASHDGFLTNFYDNSIIAQHQLTAITNCIDDAVLILDNNNKILSHNQNLNKMFNIQGDVFGQNLTSLLCFNEISPMIQSQLEFKNKLIFVESVDKNLVVSKEKINKSNDHTHVFMILFKDITDITKLENSMRKQLSKKGHIAKYTFSNIKGCSNEIRECIKKAEKIALVDKPTLIIGESGTGKELFAQAIHNASKRKNFPFIGINCAALPSELLESELFGYDEGAFTGAKKGGKQGLFLMANKGTLFLDEIGEMSLNTQAKILRVLEEKEVMKLGSGEIMSVDVRIIAATNRDLKSLIANGSFRLDLYYRLNTLIINVPPLRSRKGDILYLAKAFSQFEHFDNIKMQPELIDFLCNYPWEGNIRELKNCIEYMVYTADENLSINDLPEYMISDIPVLKELPPLNISVSDYAISLLSQFELEVARAVLIELNQNKFGRRALFNILKNQNFDISEYRLRHILSILEKGGFIEFGKGRSGALISRQGMAFLEGL